MLVVKNPPANAENAREAGSIPGSERSPGVGNGNPLQYSCLENSMGRAAWQATVYGVAKSQAWLSTHALIHLVGSEVCFCYSISVKFPNLLTVAICWYFLSFFVFY